MYIRKWVCMLGPSARPSRGFARPPRGDAQYIYQSTVSHQLPFIHSWPKMGWWALKPPCANKSFNKCIEDFQLAIPHGHRSSSKDMWSCKADCWNATPHGHSPKICLFWGRYALGHGPSKSRGVHGSSPGQKENQVRKQDMLHDIAQSYQKRNFLFNWIHDDLWAGKTKKNVVTSDTLHSPEGHLTIGKIQSHLKQN